MAASILTPNQTTKNGKPAWLVSLGGEQGKRSRRFFGTRAEADAFCRDEKLRRKAHGGLTAQADGKQLAEWLAIEAKLQKLGFSLSQAGLDRLKALEAVRKQGTPSDALDAFLKALEAKGRRKATLQDYGIRLRRFVAFLPSSDLRTVDESTIAAYLAPRKDQGGAERRTVSAFLGWAAQEGWMARNPALSKKRKGDKGHAKKSVSILSPDEARDILFKALKSNDLQILAFLTISLFGGLRPQEFAKIHDPETFLDWKDVTPSGIRISPKLAKTGQGRTVPVSPTLKSWLDFIRASSPGPLSGPVLPSPSVWRRIWDGWRRSYWPQTWHPDQLRHSFGSYTLALSRSPGDVSLSMGNSEAIVKKHYWNWETLSVDAQRFMSILPPDKQNEKNLLHSVA